MSLGLNAECMVCHFRRNVEAARALGDEATATAFARALMQLYLDTPEGTPTPRLGPSVNELFQRFYHLDADRYREEKQASNAFVLQRMDALRQLAQQAADPVYAALQLAVLGNYIDFAALQNEVSFEKLDAMLRDAENIDLDTAVYAEFCRDLEKGKTLLYLTDNAGEIGFDRIAAEEIQKAYPHLQITFCVRGGPAANDATREDADQVGIPFAVIDNGNCVAGTDLTLMSREARSAFDSADVVLSKGQANAETLLGCGRSVYYAFLIKCSRFVSRYQKPKLTAMFIQE